MKKEENNYLKKLWSKYRSNELSRQEFEEFIQFLAESKDLTDEVSRVPNDDWKESRKILEKIRKAQNQNNRRIVFRNWIWSGAAAIALLLTIAFIVWPPNTSQDIVYKTDFGETRNIELPDGSKVLLNANSELTWSENWEQQRFRTVSLDGEAFFDVAEIKAIPFLVKAADLKVVVKGTEFIVKNRGKETDVFLESGKILVEILGEQTPALMMEPGDFIRRDHQEKKIVSSAMNDRKEKASWLDGMLEFQNQKMSDILKEFESLYGKTFEVENEELLDKRMDLSLPYADWDLIQKALEIALDVKFTITDKTIIVGQ